MDAGSPLASAGAILDLRRMPPQSALILGLRALRLGMGHPWVNPHPIHGFSSLETLIHTHMGLGTILPISMGQTPYGMGNPWKPVPTALPVHHLILLQPHIAQLSFLVYSLVHAPGQCVSNCKADR